MKHADIKEFYDQSSRESYEQKRWFSSAARKAGYYSTFDTIKKIQSLYKPDFENYLELGPGPGTWTKLFAKPGKHIDLVDISEEMLAISKDRFKDLPDLKTIRTDFMDYKTETLYDLFFSSRAAEYFQDKVLLVSKINSLMSKGGIGILITKMPHYSRNKISGRPLSSVHQYQIDPSEFASILEKNGLKVIGILGTTFVFPKLGFGWLDRLLYKMLSPLPLNIASRFFAESYTVVFKKL